jgi:hypothetical protein
VLRRSVSALLSLLASTTILSGQVPASAFKTAGGSGRQYDLQSPVPLDWEAIARAARRDFDPSSPDTTLLRKYYEEIVETSLIPFTAPIPSSVPAAHYWVLGPFGVVEVRAQHVYGSIAVEVDPATAEVYHITYGGLMKAAPRGRGNFGGAYFQLFTPDSITIRSGPAEFTRDSAQPGDPRVGRIAKLPGHLRFHAVRPNRASGQRIFGRTGRLGPRLRDCGDGTALLDGELAENGMRREHLSVRDHQRETELRKHTDRQLR